MEPGGQLTTTTEVDNFPGYPEGVDGPAMMVDLQKQAERFGTEVMIGMATAVELSKEVGGTHKVTIDNNKIFGNQNHHYRDRSVCQVFRFT